MAKRPEDYTSRTFLFAMATLVVLMAISVIPPIEAGGISLRRANILSDLIRFDSDKAPAAEPAQPEIDVEEFHVDMEEVERQVARVAQEASPTGDGTSASWQGIFDQQPVEADTTLIDTLAADSLEAHRRAVAEADFSALLPADTLITPVEEFFEGEGPSPLQRLYDKLLDGSQPVRIAFMGDSFVEGDILTADLREMLQETFGGGGVGFVPAASPFTGFRQTVKTTSKGWTPYNIMQRKSVPDPYAGDFFVSGWVAAAADGASTRWDMTSRRRHLEECSRARLLFISRSPSQVSVTLNDGEVRTFGFEGDEVVRQIVVEEPQIRSLEMKVERGADGFTAYGADFDDLKGVSVDNFSIRSNNGQAMFWTSPSVNAQINSMRAGREDDTFRAQLLPAGRRRGDGRERPLAARRGWHRPDGVGTRPLAVAALGRRGVRRGLLGYVRRHAASGRYDLVRRQRLGRKGLYTHKLRRRRTGRTRPLPRIAAGRAAPYRIYARGDRASASGDSRASG